MTRQFTLVGSGRTFDAARFSDPWEGWVVPVVTAEVLIQVAAAAGATLTWDGTVAVINDERYPADADGLYLLEAGFELQRVIPAGAPPFTFRGDWAPDVEYRCWGFDRPWNGWDTPIVDRETLEAVLAGAEEAVTWSADVAVLRRPDEDEEIRLEPDAAGRYHLGELGWTFVSEDG